MRTQIPRLSACGPLSAPLPPIGVTRHSRDQLAVHRQGGMQIVSLAEAEALAEQLLNWVDFVRYEHLTSREGWE